MANVEDLVDRNGGLRRHRIVAVAAVVVLGGAALAWMATARHENRQAAEAPVAAPAAAAAESSPDQAAPAAADEAAVVRSEVASATLRVRVVDADGRALAGAPIAVFRSSQKPSDMDAPPLLVSTSGLEAIDHKVPAGTFRVVANPGRHLDGWSEAVTEIAVEESRIAATTLRLHQATASLTVRVTDDADQPLANVAVRLVPPPVTESPRERIYSFRFDAAPGFTTSLGRSGPVSIPLPALSSDAAASKLITRVTLAELASRSSARVDEQYLSSLREALRERARAGSVHEGLDWQFRAGRGAIQTDRHGVARFPRLFAGHYIVSLSGSGTVGAAVKKGTHKEVTIARQQQASIEFRLPRCGIVVVRIAGDATSRRVPSSQAPAEGFDGRVRVTSLDKAFEDERATFDLRRRLLPAPLPPGDYVVTCELAPAAPFAARTPRRVAVRSGATTEVVVELIEAVSTLKGRVVGESGVPIPGIEVRAAPEGFEPKVARTANDGSFEVQGLPPSPLRVSADPESTKRKNRFAWFGTAAQPEVYFGAPQQGVLLHMQRGATLRVHVCQSKDGPPIPHAEIRLTPSSTLAPLEVWADVEGRAAIQHLRAGTYRVDLLGPNKAIRSSAVVDVDPGVANGIVELRLTPQGAVR